MASRKKVADIDSGSLYGILQTKRIDDEHRIVEIEISDNFRISPN